MPDYFRGWKNAASHNPYFKPPGQKKLNYSIGRKSRNSLGKLFLGIWGIMKWFFRTRGIWKKVVLLGVFIGILGFIVFGLLFAYYSFNLPDPNRLADRIVPESTKIMDRSGKLLYEIHGEAKRTLITLAEVPPITKQAIIAIEDKDFYKHGGISLAGIVRSALRNLLTGSRVGGSTITQQFVRNAVLTREKTYTRKFKEIVIATQLERRYNKDEILRLYLNEIPFGSNAYGIQAAAQTYFGKDAKNLTLVESAYVAAMPQAPTYYSPYGPHKDELDARADTVLALMYEQGYITKEQRNSAQNEKIEFRKIGRGILAPHFVLYVQDLLAQKYGEVELQDGGFKVTTTLDLDLQNIAEEVVANQVPLNEKNYGGGNASLVAIDPKTGQILAMVGSRDYFDEEHDGAVNVALRPRQPGSSFKPYVYATAFKTGMSPATMLLDVITNFGEFGGKEYIPTDYDGKERGPISLRQSLQGSLNIPAVKTLILTGVDQSIDTAEAMGLTTLKDRSRYGPSLVLGGGEVKLLEHSAAFGTFSQNGIKHDTTVILKVEDKNGNTLEEYELSRGKEVLNPQVAYLINNVLSDNEARLFLFTNRNNRLTLPGRSVAAKTGTTQEFRDAWTVGYTPSLVTGVWVGNNDNSAMKQGADGLVVAAPIWNEFMRRALMGKPAEEFTRPEGIIEMQVDSLSGKLPTAYTLSTKTEVFASFNIPTESDDLHMSNGTTVLHSEKPDDPAWENPVQTWAIARGYSLPTGQTQPPSGQTDQNIQINIAAPDKITDVPWKVTAQIQSKENVKEIRFLLDGNVVYTLTSKPFEYTGQTRVDGEHGLTVQVQTESNKTNQKTVKLNFALGRSLVLLSPTDNDILHFPTNLVLEASQNIAPENVKFQGQKANGQKFAINGKITKQQIGQIFYYTLNWAESQKPTPGSYALSAEINGQSSDLVTVKIQ